MKKFIFIGLFVLGMIIPNINVKAVDVSNEEELRAAIEQGGDIYLTDDIVVKEPIVIDKDVNIYSYSDRSIFMQGDNILMTVNGGNVTLGVNLYAGWSGEYYEWGKIITHVVKDQGVALVVNGGNVNINDMSLYAGNTSVDVRSGVLRIDGDVYLYSYQNLFKFSKGNNIPLVILNGNIYIAVEYTPWPNGGISFDSDISEIKIQNNNTDTPFYYEDEKLKINVMYYDFNSHGYTEGTYVLQSNSINCTNDININGKSHVLDWCLASNENELRNYIDNNKNIRLTSDITLTSPFDIKNKNLTIDGDGWAIRQNDGALFSISGGNVILNNTWFIGLGFMEISNGAVVTYDNMETFDNSSTVQLNGGTLKIKEMRLYKDFNIDILKGVNDQTGDEVLVFENSEPIQSWFNANLNINVSSDVHELKLANGDISNKISLDKKNLSVDLLAKPDDKAKTTKSNDLDCVKVIIDDDESYVGNEDICKAVISEEPSLIVKVPPTSSNVPVIILGLGLVCILGASGIYLYMNKKSGKRA